MRKKNTYVTMICISVLLICVVCISNSLYNSPMIDNEGDIYEEIAESKKLLEDIEHYEREYYSYYKDNTIIGMRNYDSQIEKYIIPQLTTMKELEKDFPSSDITKSIRKSISSQIIKLEGEDEVWAYVSYLDNYNCDVVSFFYDNIYLKNGDLIVETHFETLEEVDSSTPRFRLIVLSIIPAYQFEKGAS